MRRGLWVVAWLALGGCDEGADGAADGAALDGGHLDRGAPADAADLDAAALDGGPDAAVDQAVLDQAVLDLATLDLAAQDLAVADQAPPDLAVVDQAVADQAAPDAEPPGCVQTAVVAGWEVFAYEASRADATAASHGVGADVCSRPGVLPWVTVTQGEAQAACEAVGFQLCPAAVWERTCAGEPGSVDYRAFPYGNAHAGGLCNDHVSGGGALEPTGARAGCVTPEGVFDLSGNVWERVVEPEGRRGASWRPDAVNFRVDAARCDRQVFVGADFATDDLGFRCCRPVD